MIERRAVLASALLALCCGCSSAERRAEAALPPWIESLRAALGAGQREQVEAELERRVEARADRYFALCLRAERRVAHGAYDEAAADLRSALECEPLDAPSAWRAWLRYELGYLTFQFVGSPEQALELFGAALAIDARHYKALQHRGHVSAALARRDAAAEDWRAALECWPDGAEPEQRAHTAQALVALPRERGAEGEARALEHAERERHSGRSQLD